MPDALERSPSARMNDWVMLVVTKKRVVELQIHVTSSSAHVEPVVRLHVCALNAVKQVENWIRKRVFDRKCSTVGVDMEWKPVFSAGHYSKVREEVDTWDESC